MDRLVDELWGATAPARAAKNLQVHIHHLRRLLGGALLLERRGGSYRLIAADEQVDARRFELLLSRAQRASMTGDLEGAHGQLMMALRMWRGPAYADVAGMHMVDTEAMRLNELRLLAHELYNDVRLRMGQDQQITAELYTLLAEHPLRERLACQLMTALARSGQQAASIKVFHQIRARLVHELGMDPGAELIACYQGILRPGLLAAAPAADARDRDRFPARTSTALRSRPMSLVCRDAELAELDVSLARGHKVTVLYGAPGVGKTALARQWARARAAAFDAQCFVQATRQTDGQPLSARALAGQLLRQLAGADGQHAGEGNEPDSDAAFHAIRALFAVRPVLVVIDDVHHPAQVRPLLAMAADAVIVITSPLKLSGMVVHDGAHLVRVPPLPERDSLTVLCYDERGDDAPDAVAYQDITRICAGLPLALRTAWARMKVDNVAPAELARRLTHGDVLDELSLGADERSIRESVAAHWRHLRPEHAALLADLAAGPAAIPSAEEFARTAAMSLREVRNGYAELERTSLLHHDAAQGYRLVPLVRAFANEVRARLAVPNSGTANQRVRAPAIRAQVLDDNAITLAFGHGEQPGTDIGQQPAITEPQRDPQRVEQRQQDGPAAANPVQAIER